MEMQAVIAWLQEQTLAGVLCFSMSDSPAKVYSWWGDRTLCLGMAGRLGFSINTELDGMEVPDELATDPVAESLAPSVGMYL